MTPDVDEELERIRRERKAREAGHGGNGHASSAGLNVWNAGNDTAAPPPRGWLLCNTFCRWSNRPANALAPRRGT